MTNVLVLGGGGMLGATVSHVLSRQLQLKVTAAARAPRPAVDDSPSLVAFDALRDSLDELLDRDSFEWIVNAVGVLKPRIDVYDPASIQNAIAVNAVFPHRLATAAASRTQRVIQIETDGVFSGSRGPYDESSPHDATDIYGKTKSLGETPAPNVVHLRCSIVGVKRPPALSLLGWALSAPTGARLPGYTNHRWNGITTLQFARLCGAIIGGADVPAPQHVVPADTVSKADLLGYAVAAFGRTDLKVGAEPGPEPVDRTLATIHREANERLWTLAGYDRPPTIREMVSELAAVAGEHSEPVSDPRRSES